MTKGRLVISITLMSVTAGVLIFSQARQIERLEMEKISWGETVGETYRLREENRKLAQSQPDATELQRLQAGQAELLRLRNEVAQLRRELKDKQLAAAKPVTVAKEASLTTSDPPVSPVDTYVAQTRATVGWQQTLITGGWMLPSGKRALVLVQPQRVENSSKEIGVQTRIIELPDTVLSQVGLQGLASENKQSSAQAILTREGADALLQGLEKASGVELLSAPTITTLDGRQAQIKVANEVQNAGSGETYETGPLIDIVPWISPDGTSVELSVIAHLRLPTNASR